MATDVTKEKHISKPACPRWMRVGFVITGIASFFGFGAMLLKAVQMVSTGRGLETYRTFWLYEFNWIGFLISCGAVVLALVLALFLRLHEHLQWRSLEKKGGSHD
ncbi:hypothetical protein AGMMS50256_12300 [Betaproteobacteria bacterium]|nr:hypothetical protein AGMMS50256_12300 [Betaproteobacteria bacterium]